MAALAEDRATPNVLNLDAIQGGYILDLPMAASDIIYRGSFVEMLATGYIQPAGIGSSLFGYGMAIEQVNNTGAAGAKTCKVLVGGLIQHAVTGGTVDDPGDPVYATDDQTLTMTAGTACHFGKAVAWVSGTIMVVRMSLPGELTAF